MRILIKYRPHFKQCLFHYYTTLPDVFYILLSWGVRSGKSTCAVNQIIIEMQRGEKGIIVGPDEYTIDSLFEKVNYYFRDLIERKNSNRQIEFKNGHIVDFKIADDPDKIISKGYNYAILDEGGKMDIQVWWNLTQRWELLKPLRIYVTTTPYNGGRWLKNIFVDPVTKEKNSKIIYCSTIEALNYLLDNFEDEEIKEAIRDKIRQLEFKKKIIPEYFWRERYEGEIGIKWEEIIYSNFQKAIVPDFEIPYSWKRIIGIDFGLGTPNACIWIAQDPQTRVYYVYREYYKTGSNMKEFARDIYNLSKFEKIIRGYADPSGGYRDSGLLQNFANLFTELKELGLDIDFNPPYGEVQAGIVKIQEMINADRLKIFASLTKLREEFETYTWERKKGVITGKPKKGNDHGLDALRYAVVSEEMYYGEEESKSIEREIDDLWDFIEKKEKRDERIFI